MYLGHCIQFIGVVCIEGIVDYVALTGTTLKVAQSWSKLQCLNGNLVQRVLCINGVTFNQQYQSFNYSIFLTCRSKALVCQITSRENEHSSHK